MLNLNGNDISLPCHSEAERRISQVIVTAEFEILHFVQNDKLHYCIYKRNLV